ncbi:MAG: 3'(2'),5'-bisphosphate nucleotidase CysQ [Verrucomicrobiota bacterium]|jgi:3'(2'), 5'-bisphosphate nucleotidase
MKPLDSLLAQCRGLALEAGAAIMGFYRRDAAVTLKSDSSPLTGADSASHDFLVRHLPGLIAGVPVISEESPESRRRAGEGQGRFWLVDPLDGTKEFVKGTGEFTVNIALIEGGRPVLGVVHAPALDLTYFAARNGGAWRQQSAQAPVPIATRRADFSGLTVVASKDHAGPMVAALLSRLPRPALQSMGSSLKFCLVAEGRADIYLRDLPTMEWDTAAAQCVVETAGGAVCSLDGRPLRYGKPGLGNPAIITIGDARLDWPALLPDGGGAVGRRQEAAASAIP